MHTLKETDEAKRAAVAEALPPVDAPTRLALDRLTRFATRLFDVPVAVITCVAREYQWFMSHAGIDAVRVPSPDSFCWHTIRSNEVMVVEDACLDDRFKNNPFVTQDPKIRFYAGAPLITQDGYGIGSLCIIDKTPRTFSADEQQRLKDLADIVIAEIELRHSLGRIQPITMLPNRAQFIDDCELMRSEFGNRDYTLAAFDISAQQLSNVARSVGISNLEILVSSLADRLREKIGPDAVLYHFGSATFACLFQGDVHEAACASLDDVVTALREPVICGNIPIKVPACAGVVRFDVAALDPKDVIRMAYTAMHSAYEQERLWDYFDENHDKRYRRSFRLLNDANKALQQLSEFKLVFQPRLNMGSGKCVGVEALLRWQHPTLGAISPGEFIPLIEGTDLVRPLTEWVLDRGMAQARLWQKLGMDLRVSVNLSGRNLDETDFVERLQAKMDLHGLSPEFLELEFTESALPRNGTRAVERLNRIRNMGVEIAIDDFGTGYSNLSHLQRLPAQILKIDQSLVRFLTTNQRDQTIVRSTMAMAHELGYRVVVEGVEDRETRSLIASWGCDEAQGYYFARPLTPEALLLWISAPDMAGQSAAF